MSIHFTRLDRRRFWQESCCGLSGLALASLLHDSLRAADATSPLSPKPSHFEAKAKSVIFLFMAGGPSHIETFDPKPLLNELHGQPRPQEFGDVQYQFVPPDAKLLGCKRSFQRYGESGIEVSIFSPMWLK